MQSAEPVIYSIGQAPLHILLHLGVALVALVIGAAILVRRKGTQSHRFLGRVWVALMLTAAAGSFFIQARGRLSLIHVLSILVLLIVPLGAYLAHTHRIRAHRTTMSIMFASLCVTGLFTLLPYRMLGQLVFRQSP